VPVEAQRLVLRQHENAAQIAVETIRERYVNDAIDPAEWNCRFRPVTRQRPQPLTLAAGQEHSNRIPHQGHGLSSQQTTVSKLHIPTTFIAKQKIAHMEPGNKPQSWINDTLKEDYFYQPATQAGALPFVNLKLDRRISLRYKDWAMAA
jgi:hypothetical protein